MLKALHLHFEAEIHFSSNYNTFFVVHRKRRQKYKKGRSLSNVAAVFMTTHWRPFRYGKLLLRDKEGANLSWFYHLLLSNLWAFCLRTHLDANKMKEIPKQT